MSERESYHSERLSHVEAKRSIGIPDVENNQGQVIGYRQSTGVLHGPMLDLPFWQEKLQAGTLFLTYTWVGIDLPVLPDRLTVTQDNGQHDNIRQHTENTDDFHDSLET